MEALEAQGRFDEAEALSHASVHEQLCDALRAIAKSGNPYGGSSSNGRASAASAEAAAAAAPEAAGNALIIDGRALQHALAPDTKDALLAVRMHLHPAWLFRSLRAMLTMRMQLLHVARTACEPITACEPS